jgi:hypothetical protein
LVAILAAFLLMAAVVRLQYVLSHAPPDAVIEGVPGQGSEYAGYDAHGQRICEASQLLMRFNGHRICIPYVLPKGEK